MNKPHTPTSTGHQDDGKNISKAVNAFGVKAGHPQRVLPTREVVVSELADIWNRNIKEDGTHDTEQFFKDAAEHTTARNAAHYQEAVNLGISIGRKEAATVLTALKEKAVTLYDEHGTYSQDWVEVIPLTEITKALAALGGNDLVATDKGAI